MNRGQVRHVCLLVHCSRCLRLLSCVSDFEMGVLTSQPDYSRGASREHPFHSRSTDHPRRRPQHLHPPLHLSESRGVRHPCHLVFFSHPELVRGHDQLHLHLGADRPRWQHCVQHPGSPASPRLRQNFGSSKLVVSPRVHGLLGLELETA